jgi:hypothetical protein
MGSGAKKSHNILDSSIVSVSYFHVFTCRTPISHHGRVMIIIICVGGEWKYVLFYSTGLYIKFARKAQYDWLIFLPLQVNLRLFVTHSKMCSSQTYFFTLHVIETPIRSITYLWWSILPSRLMNVFAKTPFVSIHSIHSPFVLPHWWDRLCSIELLCYSWISPIDIRLLCHFQ